MSRAGFKLFAKYLEQTLLHSFLSHNRYINTWMLHQIFIKWYSQLAILTIHPIPSYRINKLTNKWGPYYQFKLKTKICLCQYIHLYDISIFLTYNIIYQEDFIGEKTRMINNILLVNSDTLQVLMFVCPSIAKLLWMLSSLFSGKEWHIKYLCSFNNL